MCRICWAVGRGRRLCPSLYTSWTGFPIASPLCRVKHKWSARQWRKLSCILPFLKLGHSWFQLPDTKAIWSTRTRRVTGNLHFPVFYLLLNITFLFERNPTAFLPFSNYGRSALWSFHWKHWLGFEGWRGNARQTAVLCFWRRKSWGCSPALWNAEQQCAARRQPAWHLSAGTEVSWSSMRSAASGGVFSPLKSCFTGLMKKQTFSALVGAFFFFLMLI